MYFVRMAGISPGLLVGLLLHNMAGWSLARIYPSQPVDWFQQGQATLNERLCEKNKVGVAKNVIIMIGDGMGISTITASRIYQGQRKGQSGEEDKLSFETLPNVALSKTYCHNAQVTDSASSASAMMCGYKANFGTMGVKPGVTYGSCTSMRGKETDSILKMSQKAGKSTGFISTTKLTHATPGALYAHTPARFWEADSNVPPKEFNAAGCRDLAYQLVYDNPDINVMLAGGREVFLPNTTVDPEYPETNKGKRADGRDLTQIWQSMQQEKGRNSKYVWNKYQFDSVDPKSTDYLLGAFEPSYMKYMADHEVGESEPTLTEMVEKTLAILSRNSKGYFLLIEGGKIDVAHHTTNAYRALEETLEYARAVQKVMDLTSDDDTLLIVTADHSHTLTIGGWPVRGNDILGLVEPITGIPELVTTPNDGFPYTTLGYYNGVGSGVRVNLTGTDTTAKDYIQGVHVPLPIETHGGEDVGVFSRGPMSHLLRSTIENIFIFHVMAYASCVGPNKGHCQQQVRDSTNEVYGIPGECPTVPLATSGAQTPILALAILVRVIPTLAKFI